MRFNTKSHRERRRARHARLFTTLLALALLRTAAEAATKQAYDTHGSDAFTLGAGATLNRVIYDGTQVLQIARHGRYMRYRARATYTRAEGDAIEHATASYVADVFPSGELADSSDRDPDYLTILNQPFAAQLDRPTLADLAHLRKPLPFEFPSPFTGSSLHGVLQHEAGGAIGRRRGIAVRFEAAGRMRGPLPDRAGIELVGAITMKGTAYYDTQSALLLALDTTVTISGVVSNRASNDAVRIVYQRSLRATGSP